MVGGPGADLLRGEAGKDDLTGGRGDDLLRGGRNDDRLDGRDASGFHDMVRCGPGAGDEAFADPLDDVVSGCEVINQNDPPTDIDLAPSTVAENSPAGTLVGKLAAIDPDQNDKHKFALVAGPGSGDNGSFTVKGRRLRTSASFDFETDPMLSIRVRATDKAGESFAKSLTVTVTDVFENLAPVAVDDSRTTPEDTRLDLPVSGAGSPAANDTDANGDPLTVTAVSGAVGGRRVDRGRHDPVHARLPTSAGPAKGRFDYTVSDNHGGSDQGRVTVDITCVPDDPTAADDSATVAEDAAATAVPVLDNDGDVDGDALTIDSVTQPADGTVVITPGGTGLTYAPDADYCNAPPGTTPDTFTYTLTPGGATATVSMTVTCSDDAPVAVDDSATVPEDDPGTLIDVRANDTDVDGGPKTVESVTQPDERHRADHDRWPRRHVRAHRELLQRPRRTRRRHLHLHAQRRRHRHGERHRDVCRGRPGGGRRHGDRRRGRPATTIDVLANDTDVDGGPISIDSVTQPDNGFVTITNGGADLTYVPDADYCNSGADPDDTFTYTLNGGDSATVSVTVECFDPDYLDRACPPPPAAPSIGQPFRYDSDFGEHQQRPAGWYHDALHHAGAGRHHLGDDRHLPRALGASPQGRVCWSQTRRTRLPAKILWGSSPNTATNTTLTHPPPGRLGAGEYVTRVRWQYGQAAPGATAATTPRVNGQVINPDHAGNPVTAATGIQAHVQVSGRLHSRARRT